MNVFEEEIPSFVISKEAGMEFKSKEEIDLLNRSVAVHLDQVVLHEKLSEMELAILPVGTILWASLLKFPYWPCVLASKPEEDDKEQHVKFFGDCGRNGFVTDLMEFLGKEDFLLQKATKGNIKQFTISKRISARWEIAVKEAEEFMEIPVGERLHKFLELVEKQKQSQREAIKRKRELQKDTPGPRKKFKFDDARQIWDSKERKTSTELSESGISTGGSISPCTTIDLGAVTPIRVTPEPTVKVTKSLDIETFFRTMQQHIHRDLTLSLRKIHKSVCRFCGSSEGTMMTCAGRCGDTFHTKCTQINVNLSNIAPHNEPAAAEDVTLCPECQNGPKICFVCCKQIENDEIQCTEKHCTRSYHEKCLKVWPQAKITYSVDDEKKVTNFTCPQHMCHICTSDDPGLHNADRKAKLLKCIMCPSTYHSTPKCIPAGCELLSTTRLICPKHWPTVVKHVNVNWCFICARGGTLLCCDNCPIAVHEACADTTSTMESYICDECESGRTLTYGDLVWAKQAHYRWWPAIIVTESCIPDTLLNTPHNHGDIATFFLGSHNWTWLQRKRMFLYQEDDKNCKFTSTRTRERSFEKSLIEANTLCQVNKAHDEVVFAKKLTEAPPAYKKIVGNQPVHPVKMRDMKLDAEKFITQCACNTVEYYKCSAHSACVNYNLQIECSNEICGAGTECQNRRFTKRQYPKTEIIRTRYRGWGLVVQEDLHVGEFVIEYVGEIINNDQMARRIQHKKEIRNNVYYFLTLTKDLTIDAEHKGNNSRFINHSCDPNCKAETWTVQGATRVGIFAIKDIPKGTELTFDYHWDSVVGTLCQCGSTLCSGSIGGNQKPKRNYTPKILRKESREK